MKKSLILHTLLGAICCSGCSNLGKENTVFFTKTSLGVDIDSKPPALDVGFSRKEGTVSPELETGEAIPQMASFAGNVGWFDLDASQSFGVGNSAVLLAKYLGSNAKLGDGDVIPANEIKGFFESKKTADQPSSAERKRYLFATDTSIAVRINWALETGAPHPDSLSAGYKRKEFAFVPIQELKKHELVGGQLIETERSLRVPSLIATSGLDVSAAKAADTSVRNVQFFATGKAADYLAAQPEVRSALGIKLINDQNVAAALAEKAKQELAIKTEKAKEVVAEIETIVDSLSGTKLDSGYQAAKDTKIVETTPADDTHYSGLAEADKKKALKNFAKVHLEDGSASDETVKLLESYRDKLKAL